MGFKEQLALRYREQLNDAAIRAELAKIPRNRSESILAFSARIQVLLLQEGPQSPVLIHQGRVSRTWDAC